jgi:2-hydroxychromene-2-carboxylate isomerase
LNLNVSDETVLASVLTSAGFNAADLLAKASKQGIKDQLRANTEEAKKLGLCGVPSYRVLEKEGSGWKLAGGLVWGQDELGVVMDLVAGWREGEGVVADVKGADSKGGARL